MKTSGTLILTSLLEDLEEAFFCMDAFLTLARGTSAFRMSIHSVTILVACMSTGWTQRVSTVCFNGGQSCKPSERRLVLLLERPPGNCIHLAGIPPSSTPGIWMEYLTSVAGFVQDRICMGCTGICRPCNNPGFTD